jgi:hypothetical protein
MAARWVSIPKDMKKSIAALGTGAVLSALSLLPVAYGNDSGDAALGGFVGGIVGSGRVPVVVAPAPVVVARAPTVVVPAPVVVAPYRAPTVVYGARPRYSYSHGHYYRHHHHRHHHHDDD